MCNEARGLALSQGNRNQRASPIKISVPGLLIEKKDSFKMYGNCFIHTCSPLLQGITTVPPVLAPRPGDIPRRMRMVAPLLLSPSAHSARRWGGQLLGRVSLAAWEWLWVLCHKRAFWKLCCSALRL